MSTNKRIPKRSIIGSRVSVCCKDGAWRIGLVTAMRSREDGLMPMEKKFSVKIECTKAVDEYSESEVIGPGFLSAIPIGSELIVGQHVFVTNNGREVEGKVNSHNVIQDLVEVEAKDFGVIYKKLEDIRLMESRKSARLIHTDTDFSLLADFNIVEQRKLLTEVPSRRRLHSMSDFHDRKRQKNEQERKETKRRQRSERSSVKSSSIDVPTLTSQSRKRRTSESRAELDSGYGSSFGSGFLKSGDEIKECTAAMVLMNLCVSPRDKWKDPSTYSHNFNSSGSNSSPGFSSDVSSPTTPRPSPANSLSHIYLDEDEEPYKRSKPNNIIFQCTWRGCNQREFCQTLMERHVRQHLGLPEPAEGSDYEGEEDFYYTEIEYDETSETSDNSMDMIPEVSNSSFSEYESNTKTSGSQSQNIDIVSTSSKRQEYVKILPNFGKSIALASSAPSDFDFGTSFPHPLGDHIGMVRPSYEAPTTIYVVNTVQSGEVYSSPTSSLPTQQDNFLHSPTVSQTFQGKKLVSIVPRPEAQKSDLSEQQPFIFKSVSTQSGLKSDKKCRKVYGLDQKDLWCTQCKWKKACGRFT
eukprot:GFUD01015175.1.p1 GENE.GFUD01015175.1~~GFUD01015175.1.p1  ORF type:complete len:580 (+),score=103.80 GFUD01015175.1:324-2063(+)